MNKLFTVLLMIFFHVIADYNLQGWLASAKQKSYWEKNYPEPMYQHDYISALRMHSFSWSFMIMLPIAILWKFNVTPPFCVMLLVNLVIHMVIDDLKANKKFINLWQDQFIHMLQIIVTVIVLLT